MCMYMYMSCCYLHHTPPQLNLIKLQLERNKLQGNKGIIHLWYADFIHHSIFFISASAGGASL